MKYKFTAFIILLVIMFSSQSIAAEFTYERLIKYNFPHISNIFTCGQWESEDEKGYYRIVHVEFLYSCSWLYIQQIRDFDKDGIIKVLHTAPVYTNDHHENTFDVPECISTNNGIKLKYVADSFHDEKKYEISIDVLQSIGEFKINKRQK